MPALFIKAACFEHGHSGGPALFILTSRWTRELLATGGYFGNRRRQLAIRWMTRICAAGAARLKTSNTTH
jgi:hypothetical protein